MLPKRRRPRFGIIAIRPSAVRADRNQESIMLKRCVWWVCVLTILLCTAIPIGAKGPATKPAGSGVKDVPTTLLRDMNALFRPRTRPTSQKNYLNIMRKQTAEIILLGEAAEKKYPGAPGLSHVRGMMLAAAGFLQEQTPSKSNQALQLGIARRILDNPSAPKLKAQADFIVTRLKIAPSSDKIAPDAEKQIRAYLKRHAGGEAKVTAIVRATIMARVAKLGKLRDELAAVLSDKYAEVPGVTRFLVSIGHGPEFRAELTRLDGTKLVLPRDLLGKVVVVDFWATWCDPCIQTLPHMKQVYARYKAKGVEIVGISFDRAGQKKMLAAFVKDKKLGWIHTYSGKYREDPTGKKYGITGIPSIWVLGKDGRIVSDNARSSLEQTIDQALKAKPPKKAATK